MNLNATPGMIFKKAIDTNECVFRYKTQEKQTDNIVHKLYKCQKYNSYLNKYSILKPLLEKDKYEWKCEFCFNINNDLYIGKDDIPKDDCVRNVYY